ncbi:hypothetical protein ACFU76_30915 [Streptomyces sp. NPDC057539]|uniref:hypothetical protein n=1 Tax=Streptomyces sp. NPDC057539 TaxID=3346159 RepID=UPI0036D0B158
MDEQSWDDVAMCDIVATVLYASHLRDRQPVDAIDWQAVLRHLRDRVRVTELVTAVVPRAGHDLSRTAAPGALVTECGRWLTRFETVWRPAAWRRGVHWPEHRRFNAPTRSRHSGLFRRTRGRGARFADCSR